MSDFRKRMEKINRPTASEAVAAVPENTNENINIELYEVKTKAPEAVEAKISDESIKMNADTQSDVKEPVRALSKAIKVKLYDDDYSKFYITQKGLNLTLDRFIEELVKREKNKILTDSDYEKTCVKYSGIGTYKEVKKFVRCPMTEETHQYISNEAGKCGLKIGEYMSYLIRENI